jgi:hypothetical protein
MSIDRQTVWLVMQLVVGTIVGFWVFDAVMAPGTATPVNASIIAEWIGLGVTFAATKIVCVAFDVFRWLLRND